MGGDRSEFLYTLPEVAILTRVWTSAVRQWVQFGRLPYHTGPDGEARVRRSDLERFCEGHGMPAVGELAAVVRETEEMLAAAHPNVRAWMIRESEWPLEAQNPAERGATPDRGGTN